MASRATHVDFLHLLPTHFLHDSTSFIHAHNICIGKNLAVQSARIGNDVCYIQSNIVKTSQGDSCAAIARNAVIDIWDDAISRPA